MKKNLVIVLIILSLCASFYLFIHSRDSPKININTCSVEALEALPGIGDVLSLRIIQGRPYKDLYELDRVKGIGPATIEGISEKVVTK